MTDAAELIQNAETVLLDFDGPVCSVFAGISDLEIADRLREVLRNHGVGMPDGFAELNDPMAVLEFAAGHGDLVQVVEDALIAGEVQAVQVAAPTPHAIEFMASVRASGKRLAIVSNNCSAAIRAYLSEAGALSYAEVISGRAYARPDLMKPNTYLVQQALSELGVPAETAVLIGDSLSDVEVSSKAGVASIGYANKPGKAERLASAGATAVVEGHDGMGVLVRALQENLR